ncbi:MAG: phosphoglucomutase/phosphomannomutase family protein [Lewinellaceae bacterium]|nr:phosphoglucomutase/phosphomannomutase family protein [Lewinellaceae bacterium]
MTAIKFGTDGWRAIIADDYTVENVIRVAEATAKWLQQRQGKKVVIGYDCRFGGQLFSEITGRVLGAYGIETIHAEKFISTPMVSLGVVTHKADLGVVITASHNPPSYNGYKLKSRLGGPLSPGEVAEVEALIQAQAMSDLPSWESLKEKGLVKYADLESEYIAHVNANFDVPAIRNSKVRLAYDGMYGAGQDAMRILLPGAVFLHCDYNPSFKGQAPEPIHRNLLELSEYIQSHPEINCGLANDGDADRIGMYDEDGNFVDSHHLLLLLLLYMVRYKKMGGKVVITFSVTDKMKKMAQIFGLDFEVTRIGFKYIAEIMAEEDVIVGGEESGGLAVKGHIPERDGIWIGMMVLEFMAKTGKTLKELIREVYEIVGPFSSDRDDLHIQESQKQAVIQACQNNAYAAFGSYKVQSTESIDGFKFYFDEDRWVMIRPSGTEPVLRVYAQAPTAAEVRKILDATKGEVLN